MNMKKTIAAVAACAVAVSAMATTVSADTNTLHYNLVNTQYSVGEATGQYTAINNAFETFALTGENAIQLKVVNPSDKVNLGWGGATYKIEGYNFDTNTGAKSDAFTFTVTSRSASWSLNRSDWVDPDGTTVTIPLVAAGSKGIVKAATADMRTYIKVTVDFKHTSTDMDSVNKGTYYTITPATVSDWHEVTPTNFDTESKKVVESTLTAASAKDMSTTLTAFAYASKTEVKYPMMTDANTTTIGVVNGVYGSNGAVDNRVGVWGEVREFYSKGDHAKHLTNVYGSSSNIIAYLQDPTYNLNGEGKSYYNVAAVLNDIISKYDDVTFTFNTAADGVAEVREDVKDAAGANVLEKNALVAYKYDSKGDKKYTAFGQHLYNLYGDEATTYVYGDYDWTGYNLFNGALVINGSLSMSLHNTEVFDYAATSLSFNWEDITTGADVDVNTYVTYLQKMQLATSSTWFWDSMDVVYGNTESDDVNSGEGTDAEEDVIADDTSDEEIADDTTVDEEPADEEVPAEDEAPAEEAPAEEAPAANPATGNAPIALAVIPVALAAAAVVAKKRG